MKQFFRLAMIVCLFAGAVVAQSKTGPNTPTGKRTTATLTKSSSASSVVNDELLALLPASDLLAVIDLNRLFNQLLPSLAGTQTGGLDKAARELAEFAQNTGIDTSKVKRAVLGFNMNGLQGTGAIIVSGVDLTIPQIEAAMKELKAEFKTSDYNGKTLFSVTSKVKAPEIGPLSLNTDQLALAALGGQRFVLGDVSAIKKVIDIAAGSAKGGVKPELAAALGEAKASALARFAFSIPESLKTEAADQGDLFQSISTIKAVFGALDATADLTLLLDTVMRASSQKDANELADSLKGLLSLARGIFAGGDDAQSATIGKLLDQIKIVSKLSDVSLSISLPRATLDQLLKKPAPAEKK
ncbi:MAG: hypothetical protein ACKVZH_17730 [Blastocatellia bacterium]